MAVLRVEPVPLPRPGQSRAQHSTITAGRGQRAARAGVGRQASRTGVGGHRAPRAPPLTEGGTAKGDPRERPRPSWKPPAFVSADRTESCPTRPRSATCWKRPFCPEPNHRPAESPRANAGTAGQSTAPVPVPVPGRCQAEPSPRPGLRVPAAAALGASGRLSGHRDGRSPASVGRGRGLAPSRLAGAPAPPAPGAAPAAFEAGGGAARPAGPAVCPRDPAAETPPGGAG